VHLHDLRTRRRVLLQDCAADRHRADYRLRSPNVQAILAAKTSGGLAFDVVGRPAIIFFGRSSGREDAWQRHTDYRDRIAERASRSQRYDEALAY
jgi:hypothetical protein